MARNDLHQDVVEHVITQAQRVLGRAVHIQKQHVGLFTTAWGSPIMVNFEGLADIGGYAGGGRGFQIEVKTGDAVQSKVQKAWMQRCRHLGVKYILLQTNDEHVDIHVRAAIDLVSHWGDHHAAWQNYRTFKARRHQP